MNNLFAEGGINKGFGWLYSLTHKRRINPDPCFRTYAIRNIIQCISQYFDIRCLFFCINLKLFFSTLSTVAINCINLQSRIFWRKILSAKSTITFVTSVTILHLFSSITIYKPRYWYVPTSKSFEARTLYPNSKSQ